jgi:hypothetical protein
VRCAALGVSRCARLTRVRRKLQSFETALELLEARLERCAACPRSWVRLPLTRAAFPASRGCKPVRTRRAHQPSQHSPLRSPGARGAAAALRRSRLTRFPAAPHRPQLLRRLRRRPRRHRRLQDRRATSLHLRRRPRRRSRRQRRQRLLRTRQRRSG